MQKAGKVGNTGIQTKVHVSFYEGSEVTLILW